MAIKWVNLTPHRIVIMNEGNQKVIEPSGKICRVKQQNVIVNRFDDIPIYRYEYGCVENLPEPEQDTFFIVSRVVLEAIGRSRPDVFSPADVVRDVNGQPIGCMGLLTITE